MEKKKAIKIGLALLVILLLIILTPPFTEGFKDGVSGAEPAR